MQGQGSTSAPEPDGDGETPAEIRSADFAFEACAGSFAGAAVMAAGTGKTGDGIVASGWPYSLISYPFHRRRLLGSQSKQMVRAGTKNPAAGAGLLCGSGALFPQQFST